MIARKIRRSLDTAAARHIRSSSRDAEEEGGDTVEDTAGLSWLASSARHGKPLFGVRSLPVSHAKLVRVCSPMPGRASQHVQLNCFRQRIISLQGKLSMRHPNFSFGPETLWQVMGAVQRPWGCGAQIVVVSDAL